MTTQTLPAPDAVASASEPTPAAASTNTLSILSLVFSIVSIPTGLSPLAIAGVVLGFVGHRREPAGRTLAVWGIVVGFIALFWWVGVALAGLVGAAITWPLWAGALAIL